MRNYGFKPPAIDTQKDYFFGGYTKLKGLPLSDGHWLKYEPALEVQADANFDTDACSEYGTLNCLETLLKFLSGGDQNFSDRGLAIMAGNTPEGNDPQKVIETARTQGIFAETLLPFSTDLKSWQDWFSPNPLPASLIAEAQKFINQWNIGHEWVADDPASIKEALKYSPLGVAVYAWEESPDGLYRFPQGLPHNHWCCLIDYVNGEYWLIFDSYEGMKKVAWDQKFVYIKRYSLEPNLNLSIMQKIIAALTQMIPILATLVKQKTAQNQTPVVAPDQSLPPMTPPVPHPSKILAWALAIEKQEGGKFLDRNTLNHNPGNLKYTSYTVSLGAIHHDANNFAIFPDRATGLGADAQGNLNGKGLCQFLIDGCNDKLAAFHQARTLIDFTRVFAQPPNDNYAISVAHALGVDPKVDISTLL